jgi:hypothetical protein
MKLRSEGVFLLSLNLARCSIDNNETRFAPVKTSLSDEVAKNATGG